MKILIVRVGQLGDMIMLTPAVTRLLEKYPDADFTLLTSKDGRRVFNKYHERLRETWVYDRRAWLPYFIRRRLQSQIRAAGFDQVFCFETNPSYLRLIEGAVGTADSSIKTEIHVLSGKPGPVVHFALHCLRLVDADADTRPPIYAQIPVQDAAKQRARAIFAESGIVDSTIVVGFHPSFSVVARRFGRSKDVQRHKKWPVEHWAALAELLDDYAKREGFDLRVVMDLAPEDRALGEQIVAASHGRITLLIPPLDFERYKATLQRMNVLVAPDTGPMHLAAAVRCNLVALFSGKDPADCGPYGPPNSHCVLRTNAVIGLAGISPQAVFQACLPYLPIEKLMDGSVA